MVIELKSQASIGLEVECYGFKRWPSDKLYKDYGWKREHDQTITPESRAAFYKQNPNLATARGAESTSYAYEFVAPILTNETIDQLDPALQEIERTGAIAPAPCTLHSHAGVTNIYPEEMWLPIAKQVIINYIFIENKLSSLYPPEQLITPFAATIEKSGLNIEEAMKKCLNCESIEELRDLIQPGSDVAIPMEKDSNWKSEIMRTAKGRNPSPINLYSLARHGTLEFRGRAGTTNQKEIMDWVRFTDGMMHEAERILRKHDGPSVPDAIDKIILNRMVSSNLDLGLAA